LSFRPEQSGAEEPAPKPPLLRRETKTPRIVIPTEAKRSGGTCFQAPIAPKRTNPPDLSFRRSPAERRNLPPSPNCSQDADTPEIVIPTEAKRSGGTCFQAPIAPKRTKTPRCVIPTEPKRNGGTCARAPIAIVVSQTEQDGQGIPPRPVRRQACRTMI